jgi:surface antigen
MLRNRVYVDLEIVPGDLFRRVSKLKAPRGKRPSSDRLLARLGILRCAACGSRMVVATATGSRGQRVPVYRCPPGNACTDKQAITATIAEEAVVDDLREMLQGVKGTASLDQSGDEAERAYQAAETELAAAVEAFSGLDDVTATKIKLAALRDERDAARDRLDEMHAAVMPAITVTPDDWHDLTLDEQRSLIRAVIDRAVVAPGRGRDRVTVHTRGQ